MKTTTQKADRYLKALQAQCSDWKREENGWYTVPCTGSTGDSLRIVRDTDCWVIVRCRQRDGKPEAYCGHHYPSFKQLLSSLES